MKPTSVSSDTGPPLGKDLDTRMISLHRHGTSPLGFSIRGGWEHGIGVFVSEVHPGTEAHRQGLKVGDQILRINGFNLQHAVHDEVLTLLRIKSSVLLKVKSMGLIPIKESKSDAITWRIVDPGSPTSSLIESSNGSSSSHGDLVQVNIAVNGATSLGCSIVKGPPEVPGIFFSMIKPHGLAAQSGLCVGDQIISMNRTSFIDIEFAEAVGLIKSSQDLHLMVRKGSGLELFGSTETLPYRNGGSNGHRHAHEEHNGHRHAHEEHNGWGDAASPSDGSSAAESEKDFSLLEVEQLKEDHTRTILVPGDDILVHRPPSPPLPPPPAPTNGNFLLELQKRAEKMKTKKSSEWCEAPNGTMPDHVTKHACDEKSQEEMMKKKQHEMMMEEIHRVHRKMFSRQQNGSICTEPECPPPCCPPAKPMPIVTIGSYQSQPSRFEARTAPRDIVVRSPQGSLSSSSGSSTGSRSRWRKPPPPPPPKSAQPPPPNQENNSAPAALTQTCIIQKHAPCKGLNLTLEGGLHSPLDGRVLVSEVHPGGCIPLDVVHQGDQLLMVNDIPLIDVTLSFVYSALKDAITNDKDSFKLVIIKKPKENMPP